MPEESERRALHLVGARFGDDRQRPSGGSTDLRIEAAGDDPEFSDRVLREARAGQAQHRVGEVHAVDEDGALTGVATGTDDRSAAYEPETAALPLDAWRQEGEPLEVTILHRQRVDLLRHDIGGGIGL